MISLSAVLRSALALILVVACVTFLLPAMLVIAAVVVSLAIVTRLVLSNATLSRKISTALHDRVRSPSTFTHDRSVIDTTWERIE